MPVAAVESTGVGLTKYSHNSGVVFTEVGFTVIVIRFISWINKELEVVLRKLPETQSPRLSSSNSVSFDFKIIS